MASQMDSSQGVPGQTGLETLSEKQTKTITNKKTKENKLHILILELPGYRTGRELLLTSAT